MDGNSEQLQVINLKQLPIIEERLRDVKADDGRQQGL